MSSIQIVGLGLSTIDILMRLKEMPDWNGCGRMKEIRMDGGGPVGTAMVAAARLGASVGYIGTCGDDEVADLKMLYLTRDGDDVSRVVKRSAPEAHVVLCYVHEDTGERVFASGGDWDPANLKVHELDREYITSADFLHLDGYHYEAALQAARWMREAGKKIVLDANKPMGSVGPRMRDLVSVTDILICGSGFASALTGKDDIWEAGELVVSMGPRVVVQTEGEDGSYTITKDDRFHIPAFNVAVIDTTGAGDVFHGAYLVGLCNGWDLRRITVFASAVAAIKCTHLGGRIGTPRYAEVKAFLLDHGYQDWESR